MEGSRGGAGTPSRGSWGPGAESSSAVPEETTNISHQRGFQGALTSPPSIIGNSLCFMGIFWELEIINSYFEIFLVSNDES